MATIKKKWEWAKTKMKILLDESKKFYKANLHCHSKNSDGSLSPEEIKEAYKLRGYSAVAYTDHEHIINNSHLTDSEFVALVGCEIAIKENPTGSTLTSPDMKATHLCLYAKDDHCEITPCYNSAADHFINDRVRDKIRHNGEFPREYGHMGISEIIEKCHEEGFLVCYNHPGWSLESAEDYLGYEGADFVEIINTGSVVKGLYDDEAAFAEMLRAGKKIFCTAADDNHNRKPLTSPHSDSFGAFVMINAPSLSYQTLIGALEKGDFYASEGPEIYSLTEEDGTVHIKCSPVRKISILSRGRRSRAVYPAEGEEFITEATLDAGESADGFRIRIEDAKGKRAFTQFYPLSRP